MPHPNESDITRISIANAREQAEVLRKKDGGKAAKRKAKQKQKAIENRRNEGSKNLCVKQKQYKKSRKNLKQNQDLKAIII